MVKIMLRGVKSVVKRTKAGRRVYWYHRATNTRLPDDPSSVAFVAALERLNAPERAKTGPGAGTFSALILAYRASPEYRQLAKGSKAEYDRYLKIVEEAIGRHAVADLTRSDVMALRDLFADRPRAANYMVTTMHRLLNIGIDRGFRSDNPAARIPKLKTGPGHKPWTDAMIAQFRAAIPLGQPMRTALELGLGTGQRRGDVLKMTWGDYDGTGIAVVQGKTGARLWIPCPNALKACLGALERRPGPILCRQDGKGFQPRHFSEQFAAAVETAGLPGATFHGLRHAAATALAEAGCDTRDIMAITGHSTDAMVRHYTKGADQRMRAKAAVVKLERARNKS
jgi:integrase